MSYYFPGAMMAWLDRRFTDADGNPLALGTVQTFQAGTTTPLPTYKDKDLSVANPTTITLNANGCPPDRIYLLPQAYKFLVKDVNGVTQPHYPVDDVIDVGHIFAEFFGVYLGAGAKNVLSGYTTLVTDHFITVDSTGGADPCIVNLLASALARWPITIKNMGTVKVSIVPNGLDTIEGVNGAVLLPGHAYPNLPAVTLLPDQVNAYLVSWSHGFSVFV